MTLASTPHRGLSLAQQALLGLALGVVCGLFFGEKAAWLKVVGSVFISLLQIALLPFLMSSLLVALGSLTLTRAKMITLYAGGLLLALWGVGVLVLLLSALALPNWTSASFFSTSDLLEQSSPDLFKVFIPSNPFYAMANGMLPAVVVFSILLAVALIRLPDKEALLAPLRVLTNALFSMTRLVAALTPYGIFALTTGAAATIDPADLIRLQVYMVVFVSICLLLSLWFVPALIAATTPLGFSQIAREMRAPMLTALATGSVTLSLPLVIAASRNLIEQGRSGRIARGGEAGTHDASPVDFLVPSAYNFPDIAQITCLIFVVFAAWYIGSPLSASQLPTIIAIGLPSLFGGPKLAIPALLQALELPADLFQLFMTADLFNIRFSAMLGAMHLTCVALIGTFAIQGQLRLRVAPLLRLVLFLMVLLLALLGGIRAFYTYVVVAPYTKDQMLKSLSYPDDDSLPGKVYKTLPDWALEQEPPDKPVSMSAIRSRGAIRFCYLTDNYPLAYFNSATPSQLVGFDIEVARHFSRSLSLPAEFLPADSVGQAATLLDRGVCDIVMSSQIVSVNSAERFQMSATIYESSVGFLAPDAKRGPLADWATLYANETKLRIGVLQQDVNFARGGLRKARITPIASNSALEELLKAGAPGLDAIVMPSEIASAWSLLYPRFGMVVPKPTTTLPVAYPIANDDGSLRRTFDAWITSARASGEVDTTYAYWILGRAVEKARPPRWSVLRDVLGWTR